MTNRDWIMTLSDKQLVNEFGIVICNKIDTCPANNNKQITCERCMISWLRATRKEMR